MPKQTLYCGDNPQQMPLLPLYGQCFVQLLHFLLDCQLDALVRLSQCRDAPKVGRGAHDSGSRAISEDRICPESQITALEWK